jgi:hypothetical protein
MAGIPAGDITGLTGFIDANPDVAGATALRHDQLHLLESSADHSDVTAATPADQMTMVYNAGTGTWSPGLLQVNYGGETTIICGTCSLLGLSMLAIICGGSC